MEIEYSKFTENILSIIGFSSIKTQKNNKIDLVRQLVGVVDLFLVIIQSFMYTIVNPLRDSNSANAFFMGISAIQGVCKVSALIFQHKKIRLIVSAIDEFAIRNMPERKQEKTEKEMKKYLKIVKTILVSIVITNFIMNISPPSTYIISYFMEGLGHKTFAYSFWYPFDKNSYFFGICLYEFLVSLTFSFQVLFTDGFLMLTLGKLTVLFNNLGEEIVTVINEYDGKNILLTEDKLKDKIKDHNNLLELTGNFLKSYEIVMLVYVITYVISTCFVMFMALTVDSQLLGSLSLMLNMGAYLFYVCYFGECITSSVSTNFIISISSLMCNQMNKISIEVMFLLVR